MFEGFLVQDPFAVLPTEVRPQAVDANPIARRGYRLSRAEVETLLGEPSNEARWMVMWHVLMLTEMRVSEAIALRWCDILDDGARLLRHIIVNKQIHHRTRKIQPLKTQDCHEPPEHPLLREVLDWWQTAGWRAEYGREPRADELVVPCRGERDVRGERPTGRAGRSGLRACTELSSATSPRAGSATIGCTTSGTRSPRSAPTPAWTKASPPAGRTPRKARPRGTSTERPRVRGSATRCGSWCSTPNDASPAQGESSKIGSEFPDEVRDEAESVGGQYVVLRGRTTSSATEGIPLQFSVMGS